MTKNKFKLTAIFSVLLLTLILGLCGCGNNSGEVSDARRSMENSAAKKLRDKFADDDVTEIVVDEDVTVMGCLVINGKKTISGTGTITLDPRAKAGIYQDAAILEDGKTLTEEDLAQMLESAVLYVNKGAELTLAGEVVIDSNKSGNGVVVAEGGSVIISEKASLLNGNFCSLYNEGEVSVEGGSFAGANGYIIINDGTLNMKNGSMDASEALGNVYNLGDFNVSGGTMTKATQHNVCVADGSAVFEGGSVSGAKKANIYVGETAKAEVNKNVMVQSGTTGIINLGTLKLEEAKIERNLTQIRNYGTADIDKSELLTASVDHIVNEETGTVTITDTNLTSAGARAIANNKGKVTFKNLGVRRTGGNAICNNGGTITGEDVVIYGASGTAIDNMDAIDALGGDVKIKGIEIQTGNGMNIAQESGGKMELTDVISGITTVTNIKVVSGELVINGLEIQGTTSTGAGLWTTGGKLDVKDAVIKSTKGRGMALAGGVVTGENIVFEDIINTGIDVMKHTNLYTSAKVELDNVSFSGGDRDNVATTAANADITINGGKFGKTLGNNVRTREGVMTLNNVEVLGNELGPDGNTSYHCVYMAGGELNLNNCVLRDPLACAIRNKGGNLNATNLKTYNTPAAAITNAFNDDKVTYGNINIKGLGVYNAALGAIRNDCPGKFTVTDGYLTESEANIVMVTDGKMVVKDTEVFGSINPEKTSYHNVYIKGGTLEMTDVVLQDSATSGIRQIGGTVIGDNITIKNAKVNNLSMEKGTAILKNSTLEVSPRTNVNLTTAEASVVLTNTKINGAGDLNGNNVGCVYIGPGATATVNGGTVVTGSATRTGITCEGGILYVDGATVTGNAQRGVTVSRKNIKDAVTGVITKTYVPQATIKNAVISNNGDGTVSGGAIYCEGVLTVSNSTLSGNTGHTGGAINCGNYSNITLNGVTIKDNKAVVYKTNPGNGGGIHVSGAAEDEQIPRITIHGGNITGNTAEGKGNGIRVNSPYFAMYDSAVVNPNNEVYLESGRTIKTKTNGIGNTAESPMKIVSASTTTGTILVEADSEKEAVRANGAIACYDTTGTLTATTGFEKNVVVGSEGEVDWTARTQNSDGSWTKYLTLQAAIDAVPKNGVQTRVELMRSVTLSGAVDIAENGNRNILLTDDGNGPYTITRGFSAGTMIILRTGNDMVLEGSSKDDTNPSLIFDGAGLDAGNDQAILKVGTNSTTNYHSTLVMNAGVRMTNNKSTSAGAAIRIYGTLTMNGGVIDNNVSTGDGGAISVYDSAKLTINGGLIDNNKASKSGGAICNISSTGVGGAATVTINGGTISNNSATENAGAIFMHANGRLIINDGLITGNSSTKNGGAIYLHQNASLGVPASMEMNGGTISNNVARTTEGGAVYLTAGASIVMNGGTFSGNAAKAGGAIMLGPSNSNLSTTMKMTGGTISGNTTTENGAGIFVHANAECEIAGGKISGNIATKNGGAIYVHANTGSYSAGKHGGYGVLTITDGNIVQNEAKGEGGGAIGVAVGGILNVNGGTITANTAKAGGAVFLFYSNTKHVAVMNMTGGTICNNTTTGNGAGLFVHANAECNISGGEISGNTATGLAGAIYVHINTGTYGAGKHAGRGILTLSGGTISGNKSNHADGGGAICVAGDFTMNAGLIDNNQTTKGNGGAIRISATGRMTLKGGTISNNNCAGSVGGGGIYIAAGGSLDMQGGTITKNRAAAGAGILTFANVTMKDGTISENVSRANGGAVFVHYQASFDMQGGTISGNTSGGSGGAVYLHYNATNGVGTMTMSGGSITRNTATVNGGGVAMAHATNTLTMTGGNITGNTATEKGNDIYVPGTLNMAGEANADSIYLETGKTVNLTAALSERQTVTELILPSYTAGIKVISGDTAIVADDYTNFDVPDGKGVDIDATGCLVSNGEAVEVVAQIAQATGGYAQYATLAEAIEAVPTDGTKTTVEIIKDITLTETVTISGNRNIVLTDDGNTRTITRGFQGGRMFVLTGEAKLTVSGKSQNDANPSLIFDGGNKEAGADQQIFVVGTSTSDKSATLTIEKGVKLSNNKNTADGGAIYVYGTVDMNGGTITGNNSAGNGGGVYVNTGAKFNMTAGTITGNTAKNGNDMYVRASLSMSGEAYIGSVYLYGRTINIKGALSQRDKQTEVVLRNYEEDEEVLAGDEAAIADSYQYFKLADDEYAINDEGIVVLSSVTFSLMKMVLSIFK